MSLACLFEELFAGPGDPVRSTNERPNPNSLSLKEPETPLHDLHLYEGPAIPSQASHANRQLRMERYEVSY